MGCAITPDNQLEEDYLVSVSARCRVCEALTTESALAWAAAGRVGCTELIEAAAARADGPAACGHPLQESAGVVTSRYRFPGTGRWIGASLDLEGGEARIRLASVDPGELASELPVVLDPGTDDFQLARTFGQPANVVGAWHGALMAARLGHPSLFPCGPHVSLLVASDERSAARIAAEHGLPGEPIGLAGCRPSVASLSPSIWLGPPGPLALMWAFIDASALASDLIDEARASGLGVAVREGRLRLTLRSELLFEELELGPVVERALAHARHPRVEAAYALLSIRRELARRADVLHTVLRMFEPDEWKMAGDGRRVVLRRGEVSTDLDLSNLAIATPKSLPGLLRSVMQDAENPSQPEPHS